MTLWLAFALMTAAAIFAVLWPLSRSAKIASGSDVAVYRDQLDEVARDKAAGLIGDDEAAAARVEVSRRLIAANEAADAAPAPDPVGTVRHRRIAAVAALVFIPFAAGTIYLLHGSPRLPGEPLSTRMTQAREHNSMAAMIAKVETHLERNPNDARGWEVLAPVYLRLGRFDDAARAWRNVIQYGGDNASREADLGEALVAASNGVVTVDAKKAFDRALALDGNEVKARFYSGLAAKQDGDTDKAVSVWQALLDSAPKDAPWAGAVRQALANLGKAPAQSSAPAIAGSAAPTEQDMAAASQMTAQQRGEMIRGMVARLADRLKTDSDDADGWLRLVRAYIVLGDRDKANAALADARRALAKDPEKVRELDGLAKGYGLD